MADLVYRVGVVDVDYYRRNIRCQQACPVHTDARGYVIAIAQGDYELAYRLARESNPFVSVCGWVCNAPCEAKGACTRGFIDDEVAIRALKRFCNEQYGVDTKMIRNRRRTPASGAAAPTKKDSPQATVDNSVLWNSLTALRRLRARREAAGTQARHSHKKVAIVGAGPAGLSCAHDLALLGYPVTVFEAGDFLGGMITAGVPEHRLPRELVDLETQAILDLGVEVRLNQRLGRDFFVSDLKDQGYEAIFIAIGAFKSRDLRIDGLEMDGVLRAVDFILNVNQGYRVDVGDRVVVVGGGDVAMDAARSAARVGREGLPVPAATADHLMAAVEAARTAIRRGAREVHICCLESREEMPASEFEVEDALMEGVVLHARFGPRRILGEDGKVSGIELQQVSSVFDENRRFNPQFIAGSEIVFPADTIILAIGQTSDFSWVRPEDGIEVSPRSTIVVERETLATTAPGIFAGGDVAFGPRLIIDAVADGQRVARSIDAYLRQEEMVVEARGQMQVLQPRDYLTTGYLGIPRESPPALPIERRIGVAEVDMGYNEEQAVAQGIRCMKCHINTVFNAELCILCNACVDVCPWDCLKIVDAADLAQTRELDEVGVASYGVVLEKAGAPPDFEVNWNASAMLKDDTRCTRCALCEMICPTKAITMEAFQFEEERVIRS